MKNFFLVLGLLLSLATAAQAQHRTTVGITAAYADSRLAGGGSSYNATNHSAYQAGLMGDVYFSESLSFHPEVLYTLRYFDTTDNEDLNRDFSNLDVPLLARYHVGGLFFEAGPQVSIPLTTKNEDADNVKSEAHPVVLDYVLGLGYQLKGGLSAGVRFDGGATNLFKNSVPVLGSDKLKSNTFLFVVGYAFGNSRP